MSHYRLERGDCLEHLRALPDASVDSIVTDPPYGLSKAPRMQEVLRHWLAGDDYQHRGGGFMGKAWDSFVPGPAVWKECLRVLKPGGHLLSFFGTRTYDMGVLAIRLAGFEIRDQIAWVYGSGFPKSQNVGKAIDKTAGATRPVVGTQKVSRDMSRNGRTGDEALSPVPVQETLIDITAPATEAARQWEGWGTALKPALEPIVMARKPLSGTVAGNVLKHGTGALNIDGCRIPTDEDLAGGAGGLLSHVRDGKDLPRNGTYSQSPSGRWPANLVHDGSDEVTAAFPDGTGAASAVRGTEASAASNGNVTGKRQRVAGTFYGDRGNAARFFYCAKASKSDRNQGLETAPDKVLARSCQAQADATRGNTVTTAGGAYNYARITKNNHPTVKPTALMRWLLRLVTPPGGTVLDPYTGSGSTGKAAILEGFQFIGFERDEDEDGEPLGYIDIARARLDWAVQQTITERGTQQ